MATAGRPVERPVHLGPEQRQRAQRQTAQWRDLTGLSQPEMADRVGVGHSTYRMWETGKDPYAGPTRLQARQLNDALRRLLRDQYADGEAFEVWGWPAENQISYEKIAGLLRPAGFAVPNSQPAPSVMFWLHRLREPNLVHAVFSLAAAAATRAGVLVRLLLDDVTPVGYRGNRGAEFEAQIRTWMEFAGGDNARLSVKLYSDILTPTLLADRGWASAENYLSSGSGVLDLLLASKAVSPLQYSTDAEQSILELIRQGGDSLKADRLLTPLRNWLVFDTEVVGSGEFGLSNPSAGTVITLGAEDERVMWEVWHRGSPAEASRRVQHIYLRPAPLPSYRVPWQEPALSAQTSRTRLATYLIRRASYDGNPDLIEWFLRAAVSLPSCLNSDFLGTIDPVLLEPGAVQRLPVDRLANAVAQAVVAWVNP